MSKRLKMSVILLILQLIPSAGTWADSSYFFSDADNKVVYDVKTGSQDEFSSVLDRISYLNSSLGSDPLSTSIVVVLHGDEIKYFARNNEIDYAELVERTLSLTVGETIEFRVCRVSASRRGYRPADLQPFVRVVPMADAEIVQLQFNGYAYMR